MTHNVFSRGREHDIVTKLSYNWFVPVLVINGRHGNNHVTDGLVPPLGVGLSSRSFVYVPISGHVGVCVLT